MDYNSFLDDIIKGVKEEDQELEFKSSFFALPNSTNFNGKDYNDKVLNRLISFQCVKAVIGLMNSNGGHLVIGVSDNLNESYMRNLFNLLSFKGTNISEDAFRSKFTDIFIDGNNPFLSEEEFINHVNLKIVSYNPNIKIGIVKVNKYIGNKGIIIINDYQKVIETNHSGKYLDAIFQRVGNKTKNISSAKKIFDLVASRIQNSSLTNTSQNKEETISSSKSNVLNFKLEQNKIRKNNEDTFSNPFKSGKEAKKIIDQFFKENENVFQHHITQGLSSIPSIHQEAFKKRFTLENNIIYTTYFWSIAQDLGVSEGTARKYYNDALNQLKDIKRASKLEDAIVKFVKYTFHNIEDFSLLNQYIEKNLVYENKVYKLVFDKGIYELVESERQKNFCSLLNKLNLINQKEKEILFFSDIYNLLDCLNLDDWTRLAFKLFSLNQELSCIAEFLSCKEEDFLSHSKKS